MSMGARRQQIRRIFMLQGVLIGVVGSTHRAGRRLYALLLRQQIPLGPAGRTVYSLSFVPFEPRWWDGLWIAEAAILVSFPGYDLSGAECHPDRARRGAALRIGSSRSLLRQREVHVDLRCTSTGLPFSSVASVNPLLDRFQRRREPAADGR